MAAAAPPQRQQRLRVLCLHGFRTNARIMEEQMAPLTPFLRDFCDFVFLDGVMKDLGPPTDVVAAVWPNEEHYCQWFDSQNTPAGPLTRARGIQRTISYFQEYLSEATPAFDVVLGFSQGAMMASHLTGLLEADELDDVPAWRAVVLASGLRPRDTNYQYLFESSLSTRSVHLYGTADNPQSLELSREHVNDYDEGSRLVLEHSEGHKFPSQEAAAGQYQELRMALRALLREPGSVPEVVTV